MKSFKIGTAISLALMIVLTAAMQTAAGQLQQQLAAESALETIMKRGVLKVGMDIFKPWAMKDKTGQLIGFEIDVAKRLAKDMGVKAEFVPTNWNGIIPALLTGKFDVIIGGMSVRPDRNLKVNFSIPYDYAGQSIVANRKLAGTFTSLDEFNRSDVVVFFQQLYGFSAGVSTQQIEMVGKAPPQSGKNARFVIYQQHFFFRFRHG